MAYADGLPCALSLPRFAPVAILFGGSRGIYASEGGGLSVSLQARAPFTEDQRPAAKVELHRDLFHGHDCPSFLRSAKQRQKQFASAGGLTRRLGCIDPGEPRLFVDSAPGFGYSGDLARCCAWGLCVCTRTNWSSPDGGSAGTGHRLLNSRQEMRIRLSQSPLRASPGNSHPNRIVWKWVEIGPVRFWHGQMHCVRSSG
jgi:hypothetical protein